MAVPVAFGFITTLLHGCIMNMTPVRPAVCSRRWSGIAGLLGFKLSRFDTELHLKDMAQRFVEIVGTHDMQMLDAVRITPLQAMHDRRLVVTPGRSRRRRRWRQGDIVFERLQQLCPCLIGQAIAVQVRNGLVHPGVCEPARRFASAGSRRASGAPLG